MERFSSKKFWLTRIGTVLIVAIGLYLFQIAIVPQLGIYDIRLVVLSLLFGSLAVSLNLINGITGQFSMGHAAFYLIGAYTSGKLSTTYFDSQPLLGWMWLIVVVLAAALAAAIAGFVVGLPSLRLRGDYLAIVTLGFGEIARVIVINQDGSSSSFWHLDLGGAYAMNLQHYKFTEVAYVALLFIVTVAIARNLLKTAHGLSFLSVREDEIAAEATGVNTTRVKVTSFVIGAALAGMAGALFAHYNGAIAPDDFKMDVSFLIVAMVVIGGTGSITGAAIAGVFLKLLEEALRKLEVIPAISLVAYLLALAVVFTAYKMTTSKRPLTDLPAALLPLRLAGWLGCLAIAYGGVLLWRSDFSIVLKVAGVALIVAMLVGFFFAKHRDIALPRFGALFTGLVAVSLLKIPIAAGLNKVPAIYDNLKDTLYTPSDLRWALFAMSLVIVMLVRSQGLFGHHEFSWDFVKKFAGLPHKEHEVAV